MEYNDFIQQKQNEILSSGFECEPTNKHLFDFQRHLVKKALSKGRYALFADCGLGKTLMQLSWAYEVVKHTDNPVLILCPLAVAKQTIEEGRKFEIEVQKLEPKAPFYDAAIYVTNYEQLDKIEDISVFDGVVLDESSIIKNFQGKTKELIFDTFKHTLYKLACTATPSPNDVMELLNHAEFLGHGLRVELLAEYFIHDGGETQKWRLKKHAKGEFWGMVSQWSSMVTNPSDLGFDGSDYILPELSFIEKEIKTPQKNNGLLFNETAVSATNFNQELRLTKVERMEEVAQIVNNSNEPFIVWIKQNEEEDLIKSLIPDAVCVRGSEKPEIKEKKLLGFADGDFRVLVTKTKIAQFGLNYQHCRNQVFASLDFSFEGLYQAIRRSYRFGQTQDVNIYLITTDTMQNVIHSIKTKQKQFEEMQEQLKQDYCQFRETNSGNIGRTESGDNWLLMEGDCVQRVQSVPSESVGFSIFSPPFAELYTYSDSPNDMGNSKDYKEFEKHFSFLVPELYRILLPGRLVAIHCMDLPIQKGKEGFIGLRDFSGMLVDWFTSNGFIYHDRVTIWKNPVTEMQRTKALGLLHKTIKKDAVMSRTGIPDYLLVFRKKGDNPIPVTHQDKDPNQPDYLPVDLWQKYASPVWEDIDYSKTLQFTTAKEKNDEKHICPLQLPTIERALHLWTNEGDTVFTPFGGIGSELYQALKMNRKAIGIELKKSYFDIAVKNCKSVVMNKQQKTLF